MFSALLALGLSQDYSVVYIVPPGDLDFPSVRFPRFNFTNRGLNEVQAEQPPLAAAGEEIQARLEQCRELEVQSEKVAGFLVGDSERLQETETYFSERTDCELRYHSGEAVGERLPLIANFVSSIVEIRGLNKLTFKNLEACLEKRTELIKVDRPRAQLSLELAGEPAAVEAVEINGEKFAATDFLFVGPGNQMLRSARPGLLTRRIEREKKIVVETRLSDNLEFKHPVLSEQAGFFPLTSRCLQLVTTVENFESNAKLTSGKLLELLHEACEIFPCLYEAEFNSPEISFNRWGGNTGGLIDEKPFENLRCIDGHGCSGLSLFPEKLEKMEVELR